MQEKYPYVTLIRTSGSSNRSIASALRNLPNRSSKCKVLGAWTTFGEYDGLVQFIAQSNEEAMEYVTKNIRSIQGVTSTETLPLITQQSYIEQIPE